MGIRIFVNKVSGNIYHMLVGVRGQCFKHGFTGMILFLLRGQGRHCRPHEARRKQRHGTAPAAEGGQAGSAARHSPSWVPSPPAATNRPRHGNSAGGEQKPAETSPPIRAGSRRRGGALTPPFPDWGRLHPPRSIGARGPPFLPVRGAQARGGGADWRRRPRAMMT